MPAQRIADDPGPERAFIHGILIRQLHQIPEQEPVCAEGKMPEKNLFMSPRHMIAKSWPLAHIYVSLHVVKRMWTPLDLFELQHFFQHHIQ